MRWVCKCCLEVYILNLFLMQSCKPSSYFCFTNTRICPSGGKSFNISDDSGGGADILVPLGKNKNNRNINNNNSILGLKRTEAYVQYRPAITLVCLEGDLVTARLCCRRPCLRNKTTNTRLQTRREASRVFTNFVFFLFGKRLNSDLKRVNEFFKVG